MKSGVLVLNLNHQFDCGFVEGEIRNPRYSRRLDSMPIKVSHEKPRGYHILRIEKAQTRD